MTKKGLYILSAASCAAGYVWLVLSSTHAGKGILPGCIFKRFFHIPCPSCGSTRAIIALWHGNFNESLSLNPNGILLALLMLAIPVWILMDVIGKKDSYYRFYMWVEQSFGRRCVLAIFICLVLINWFWNIYKGL